MLLWFQTVLLLQVCVDMGEPILEGAKVPTTLPPTQAK
jgi:hypothetical protein